ncbi:MAG: translation initiation factor IF-2 N-terminal domain-containing protein, partial [Leptotrichia wadei]
MKVHELAKESGFTASKFMEEIRKFGIDKRHHMNVLSSEEVNLIRKKLQKNVQNQNQSDGSKTENLNKNEGKPKETAAKTVNNHSDNQKNNSIEQNKSNEQNINKNYDTPKRTLEKKKDNNLDNNKN